MSERIAAVIPVRSLRDGKTRLAAVLTPGERQALIERMLRVVVAAARAAPAVACLAVVTPDPAAAVFATALAPGVRAIRQPATQPGLNAALALGREWAVARGADRLLTLSADLPWLTADDVGLLAAAPADLALARDDRGDGSNGLALTLDTRGRAFRFAFGEASAWRHAAEARRLDLSLQCVDLPGTGFDLDEPADLALLDRDAIGAGPAAFPRLLAPCGARADR
ncbi:MAG TPA: 2-phospho-L-lactate guanylyltransferase [Thermomicrobiales bacterium]|nr:2-phospho-L-lactate guanylyltransferase [Thermomicrobiales bacterium]